MLIGDIVVIIFFYVINISFKVFKHTIYNYALHVFQIHLIVTVTAKFHTE